jgi:hypothetical protein
VKPLHGNRDFLLPPIWVVGLTGHRHLRNPEKMSKVIETLLDSLRAEVPGQLVGYSSAAIGADTLFAEACLSSGLPWMALLPQSEHDFKNDFGESDWEKTSSLLRRAARVQSLSWARETDRNLAYLECGLLIVEEADVMIAVWDGKPSRGVGGTADVVANARNLNKPLILIHPDSLAIQRERFSVQLFSDPEMTYLNQLPHGKGIPPPEAAEPEERVRRFFQKVDAKAAGIAPKFRRWVAASVIMNALAAILVAAKIGFEGTRFEWTAIIVVLMAGATIAVALIKRKGAHREWIRCRVASEICRSALATWKLADVGEPVWFNQLAGFTRLAKTIRLLKLTDERRQVANLGEWRQKYLTSRVDEQIHYFRRRRQELGLALSILSFSFWTFSALGIGLALVTASAFGIRPVVSVPESEFFVSHALKSFLPIALPLAAGCALSLISIFDLTGQLARSRAMESLLNKARDQIEKCESLPSLRRAVENTENAFASEVFEWFTLFRYPRFN